MKQYYDIRTAEPKFLEGDKKCGYTLQKADGAYQKGFYIIGTVHSE